MISIGNSCLRGRRFPPCRDCGSKVAFVLVHKAKNVGHHELFSSEISADAVKLAKS